MACRKQLKLPSLKVTARSPSGTTFKRVKRGKFVEDLPVATDPTANASSGCTEDSLACFESAIEQDQPTSSIYSIKQQSTAAAWEPLRTRLLQCGVEEQSMAEDKECNRCNSTVATIRCLDCGPRVYYCPKCCIESHSLNWFHKPEIWQVSAELKVL